MGTSRWTSSLAWGVSSASAESRTREGRLTSSMGEIIPWLFLVTAVIGDVSKRSLGIG